MNTKKLKLKNMKKKRSPHPPRQPLVQDQVFLEDDQAVFPHLPLLHDHLPGVQLKPQRLVHVPQRNFLKLDLQLDAPILLGQDLQVSRNLSE